jgi:hypothetical protein
MIERARGNWSATSLGGGSSAIVGRTSEVRTEELLEVVDTSREAEVDDRDREDRDWTLPISGCRGRVRRDKCIPVAYKRFLPSAVKVMVCYAIAKYRVKPRKAGGTVPGRCSKKGQRVRRTNGIEGGGERGCVQAAVEAAKKRPTTVSAGVAVLVDWDGLR